MGIRQLQKRHLMLSSPGAPLIQEHAHLEVRYGTVFALSKKCEHYRCVIFPMGRLKGQYAILHALFPMLQGPTLPRRRGYRGEKERKENGEWTLW